MDELIHIKCSAWYVAPGKDSKKWKQVVAEVVEQVGKSFNIWHFSLVRIDTTILNCLILLLVCLVEI